MTGEYIISDWLKNLNSSDWREAGCKILYFANEHELATNVQEGNVIIVRWVFDAANQQYVIKGIINETELLDY